MIWGYDYSARLIVDVIILVVILSVHFLQQHKKNRQNINGESNTSPVSDDEK